MSEDGANPSNYGDIMVPHCPKITHIVAPFNTHVPGFGFWVSGFRSSHLTPHATNQPTVPDP